MSKIIIMDRLKTVVHSDRCVIYDKYSGFVITVPKGHLIDLLKAMEPEPEKPIDSHLIYRKAYEMGYVISPQESEEIRIIMERRKINVRNLTIEAYISAFVKDGMWRKND